MASKSKILPWSIRAEVSKGARCSSCASTPLLLHTSNTYIVPLCTWSYGAETVLVWMPPTTRDESIPTVLAKMIPWAVLACISTRPYIVKAERISPDCHRNDQNILRMLFIPVLPARRIPSPTKQPLGTIINHLSAFGARVLLRCGALGPSFLGICVTGSFGHFYALMCNSFRSLSVR